MNGCETDSAVERNELNKEREVIQVNDVGLDYLQV